MSLELIRREHEERGIGELIHDLLWKITMSTASRFPARAYTDDPEWTMPALQDVFQGWVTDSLLGRRQLNAIMSSAATEASLRRMLTTCFEQYMINRRKTSSAANLYDRTRRLLESDAAFQAVASGRRGVNLWTLARAPQLEVCSNSASELLAAAWELSDDDLHVVRYGPESKYESPILREADLKRILEHLLSQAQGAVELRTLHNVLRHRFNLLTPLAVEVSESIASLEDSPPRHAEVNEQAEAALRRLGHRLSQTLRVYVESDEDTARTADRLGIAVATVRRDIATVRRIIGEFADTEQEAVDVYHRIVDSLF